MKNFRKWETYAHIVWIGLFGACFVIYTPFGLWVADVKQENQLRTFEQVLAGQQDIDVLANEDVRHLANSLVISQQTNEVSVLRNAESEVRTLLDWCNKDRECGSSIEFGYVRREEDRARALASRQPGTDSLVRDPKTLPSWLDDKSREAALIIVDIFLGITLLPYGAFKLIQLLYRMLRLRKLEKKYTPRYKKAVEDTRYRAPALDDEMTPASLRVADEARLIRSDPGEVDELISLQPAPSISKTVAGQ
ncbi:MAG: hypothetical protein PHS79_01300 [Patescibacteria group bacterium]|nr:hypothetical protein [Patescibacteria group bacterium]